MLLPKTVFTSSLRTEAERIIFISTLISNGFYRSKGFHVLPKLVKNDPKGIFFPKLDYSSIPDLWPKTRDLDDDLGMKYDEDLLSAVENLLKNSNMDYFPKVERIKSEWENIQEEFWVLMRIFFVDLIDEIKEVDIRVTKFGSNCSFNYFKSEEGRIICYIREDIEISSFAEAIISSLATNYMNSLFYTWEEVETFTDFLLSQSKLKLLFKDYSATLQSLKNIDNDLLNESLEYISSLGVSSEEPKIDFVEDKLIINNKDVTEDFSATQLLLLRKILEVKNEIVTFGDLGDSIWTDSDDYSPWALTKNVQRLRDKLSKYGFSKNYIKTLRGRGVYI